MQNDRDEIELTDAERAMFAALPHERASEPAEEDRLVDALRADGYFRRRDSSARWVLQFAAAIALFAGGAYGGARYADRNSLERMLDRTDLTMSQRVLLLQRAGSAYVHAANGYADATATVDSSAMEVASQVLLGAAQAVARRSLDGGMTARLATMLQYNAGSPQRVIQQ